MLEPKGDGTCLVSVVPMMLRWRAAGGGPRAEVKLSYVHSAPFREYM